MYLAVIPPEPCQQPRNQHGDLHSSTTSEPQGTEETHTLPPLQPGLDQQSISCLIRYLKTKFPLELFLRLADFMDTTAFLNLRLACRELEVALFPIFRKRFFTKRHICLTEKSIRRLVTISQDSRLCDQLTTVTVGCRLGLCNIHESEDDGLFIEAGFDIDLLSFAFTNLIKLDNVTITYSPFISRPNIAPQFAAMLGRDNPRKLFRKLLGALGKGSCELSSFAMEHHGGTGGGFCMSDLHLSDSLQPLSRSLRTLKRLTLALTPSQDHTPYLMKFLAIPQRLEQFRINLDRDSFMPGLAALRAIREAPPLSLSCLTELELGKMTVTPRELIKFVRVFAPSLRKLQFFRVGLLFDVGDSYPYEHGPEPSGDPPYVPAMLWKFVFEELSEMPELEKLVMFSAGWLTERTSKHHVGFRQTPPGVTPATRPDAAYNGVGASRFLGELAEHTVVPSPRGGLLGRMPQDIAGVDASLSGDESDSDADEDMDDDSEEE